MSRLILHVDLGAGRHWSEEIGETWLRRLGGGGALGAWLLTAIEQDADAPNTLTPTLVFATSVVGGLGDPGLSRHSLISRSPLTGLVAESQAPGYFAAALRRAGLLAIVVHGESPSPVTLATDGVGVELRDADGIWGSETADADSVLGETYPDRASIAAIGPAGERQVPFASVVHDRWFQANRCGLGAVMGAKRLKAVVVHGGRPPSVAHPELLETLTNDYRAGCRTNPHNRLTEDMGVFGGFSLPGAEKWPISAHNFRDVTFGEASGVPSHFAALLHRYQETAGPRLPGMERHRRYGVPEGPYATDPRYGSMEDNSVLALGYLTDVDDTEAVLKAIEQTYRFGLDAESLAGTVAWAMECHERGLQLPWDGNGPPLRFGDGNELVNVVEEIAMRNRRGTWLARGCASLARELGPEYERLAMTCGGKELPPHDPRDKAGVALGYAVSPIGPDYATVEFDWDFSPAGLDYVLENSVAFGVDSRLEVDDISLAKAAQVVKLQRWWSGALESLLFDIYSVAPARFMSPSMVVNVVRAVTGWDYSLSELLDTGARRIALMNLLNASWNPDGIDRSLPRRFHVEDLCIPGSGDHRLDESRLSQAAHAYFELIGCDDRGRPSDATLAILGLESIPPPRHRVVAGTVTEML